MPATKRAHLLSLRIAWRVAVCAAAVMAVLALLGGGLPLWGIIGADVFIGAAAYAFTWKLLARRISLAHRTLLRIRASDFRMLDAIPADNHDELSALLAQLYVTGRGVERQIHDLERMANYRREFLGNVSHELRTPIFSIKGFADTLLSGALQDANVRRPFVEKIQRNAQRLENLAEDLGEVARIESGELAMIPRPFSLRQVAGRVIEGLEGQAASMRITVHQNIPDGLPPVMGDSDRIGQVLSNLLDNAIKYNRPGGRVEIIARLVPNGLISVHVVDSGIGIAPEHMDRLTDRFFRIDNSRSRSLGGTGLGLTIVKHILGAHDRQLRVKSHPGSGSTFGFTLPVVAGT